MVLTNRRHHKRFQQQLILTGLLLSVLCGCNSIDKAMSVVVPYYSYDKTELDSISIEANADSNGNMPVAIDFVFIGNDALNPVLMALSGPDWFSNKRAMLLKHQKDLVVAHVEIVPLTIKQAITLPEGYDDAVKVLMYADYADKKGQLVADITLFDELLITLQAKGYQLKELDP